MQTNAFPSFYKIPLHCLNNGCILIVNNEKLQVHCLPVDKHHTLVVLENISALSQMISHFLQLQRAKFGTVKLHVSYLTLLCTS